MAQVLCLSRVEDQGSRFRVWVLRFADWGLRLGLGLGFGFEGFVMPRL